MCICLVKIAVSMMIVTKKTIKGIAAITETITMNMTLAPNTKITELPVKTAITMTQTKATVLSIIASIKLFLVILTHKTRQNLLGGNYE